MLRRTWKRLTLATGGLCKLVSEHAEFLFVLLLESHVGLFHRIDLFSDKLHLAHLSGNLMLKTFSLAELRLELSSNLLQELIEAGGVPGGDTTHCAMRIHGHLANRCCGHNPKKQDCVSKNTKNKNVNIAIGSQTPYAICECL